MDETWTEAGRADSLIEGEKISVVLNGWAILICRLDGVVHAVIDRCTHAGSPLHGGRLRRGAIMCPLHGARFDVVSGKCLGGPYPGLVTFRVEERGGMLVVAVPSQPPSSGAGSTASV